MAVGVAEDYARGFGEDYTFGVSQPLFAETDTLGGEGDVGVFRDEFRIDNHSGVFHAAEVENLGEVNVDGAEFGYYDVEVDPPDGASLMGGDVALDREEAQSLDETGTAEENFARRSRTACECGTA